MASTMPSTGTGVAEREPVAHPFHHQLALRRRVGQPASAVRGEHVGALVAHHLPALDGRVGVEDFLHLPDRQRPRVVGHAARGVDDEDDVFAVDRQAADGEVVSSLRRYCAPSSRFISSVSVLLRRDELVPRSGSEPPPPCGRTRTRRAASLRSPRSRAMRSSLLGELDSSATCSSRFSTSLVPRISTSSFWSFEHLRLQVLARLLDDDGLADLGEHQQQDHGAETAADASRNDRLKTSTRGGRVCELLMASPSRAQEEPRGRCAPAASRHAGAIGSPSIGSRITFTGCGGQLADPWSSWHLRRACRRPSPSMVLRDSGADAPCVGRPSVMQDDLSGRGVSVRDREERVLETRAVPGHGLAQRRERIVEAPRHRCRPATRPRCPARAGVPAC